MAELADQTLTERVASRHLLMIGNGENKHCTSIKNISMLLSNVNGKSSHAYHFCKHCLNGFWTASVRDKHSEEKDQHVCRKDQHAYTSWMLCTQHVCLWRYF